MHPGTYHTLKVSEGVSDPNTVLQPIADLELHGPVPGVVRGSLTCHLRDWENHIRHVGAKTVTEFLIYWFGKSYHVHKPVTVSRSYKGVRQAGNQTVSRRAYLCDQYSI